MMDDFRPSRESLERHDYSAPVRQPAAHPPRQQSMPPSSETPIHQPPPHQPAAHPHHVYHRPPVSPPLQPQPAASRQPAHKTSKKPGLRYLGVAIGLILAAGLFTAGYIAKSHKPDKTIPQAVVSQAKYNVYFPSPMPSGYTYVSKTATFQVGSVFYRFADGLKSVTVREEPMPAKKPNLSLYAVYVNDSTTT